MTSIFFHRGTFIVLATTFMGILGFHVVSPALPAVRDAFGLSNTMVAWVMAAYGLPALVFVPLTGFWADRYGKKTLLTVSLIVFGLAGGAIAFAPNAETLLILRFVQGVAASAFSNLNFALATDLYAGEDRVRIMGYVGATQNIGSGLLPLIGGGLAVLAWSYPFLVNFLAIPVGIYVILYLDNIKPERTTGARTFVRQAFKELSRREVVEVVFLIVGFIFVAFGPFITYLPILLHDKFGTTGILIGLIISARAFTGTLAAMQLYRLTRRFTYRQLIGGSFCLLATSMILVPFYTQDWMVMLTAMMYGSAFGVLRPALQVLLLNRAPDYLRATFASASGFSLRLAQTTSPLLAGYFLLFGSLEALYVVAAALTLALAVFCLGARGLTPDWETAPTQVE